MRSEREEQLWNALEKCDYLSIPQVAELLGTTPATARRVVNRLAEHQVVRRVHGGVRRMPPEWNSSIPQRLREQWFGAEKRLLARRAMELVPQDAVLFIQNVEEGAPELGIDALAGKGVVAVGDMLLGSKSVLEHFLFRHLAAAIVALLVHHS